MTPEQQAQGLLRLLLDGASALDELPAGELQRIIAQVRDAVRSPELRDQLALAVLGKVNNVIRDQVYARRRAHGVPSLAVVKH
jgi:hypothetical protein